MSARGKHLWADVLWTSAQRFRKISFREVFATEPEVCQLDVPVYVYKHVLWL